MPRNFLPHAETASLTCPRCNAMMTRTNSKEWMLCRFLGPPCVNFVHLLCYPHGFCYKTIAENPSFERCPPLTASLELGVHKNLPPPLAAAAPARRKSLQSDAPKPPRASSAPGNGKVRRANPERPAAAGGAKSTDPQLPCGSTDMLLDPPELPTAAEPAPACAPAPAESQPAPKEPQMPGSTEVQKEAPPSPIVEPVVRYVRSANIAEEEDSMIMDEEPPRLEPTPTASQVADANFPTVAVQQPKEAKGLDSMLKDQIMGHIAEALMRASQKAIGALHKEICGKGIPATKDDIMEVLAQLEAREVVMVDGSEVFRI